MQSNHQAHEKKTLVAERDALAAQLAAAQGRLKGLQTALGAVEARARAAEVQLAAVLDRLGAQEPSDSSSSHGL